MICTGSTGTASAAGHSGDSQYIWNRDGAFEQPAVDVFPAGIPSLPERTLCAAHIKGGSRTGDFVSGVRGEGAGTKCGGTGI